MHNLVTRRKQEDCKLLRKASSDIENTIIDFCFTLLQLISANCKEKWKMFKKKKLNVYIEGSVNILFCFNFIFLFNDIDTCCK